ncbi:MAG: hypothetical protein R3Y59_09325 [bacterium]
MKKIIFILLVSILPTILYSQDYTREQGEAGFIKAHVAMRRTIPEDVQKRYNDALDEIHKMLKGELPLSFKRAVFLVEYAEKDGKLSWDEFNSEILRIKPILEKMIVDRNLQSYKTSGNWAIFTYMCDSIPENDFTPYTYDIENFLSPTNRDAFWVSHLLKSKKGNCHSMPYLYKILANEIDATAYLSIVPLHCYIKHQDEDENWWNVEVTSGTFSRSSYIMDNYNVSETAIKSGLFMDTLSQVESVAHCLYDLLVSYDKKTGRYSDDFVTKCYEIGLQYYPISEMQVMKLNDLQFRLDCKIIDRGLAGKQTNFDEHPDLKKELEALLDMHKYIKKIGHSTMSQKTYEEGFLKVREQQLKARQRKQMNELDDGR